MSLENEKYTLRLASKKDIYDVINLIKERIDWMDEKGIKQWNKTNYLSSYPMSYFEDLVDDDLLYVLVDPNNIVVGAMALLEYDPRWPGYNDALFVHNLVSKKGIPNLGKVMINKAIMVATSMHKKYLRLDASSDNQRLNHYYQEIGFEYIDSFDEGDYSGNLLARRIDN